MKLNITNQSTLQVEAPKTSAKKKPTVQKGGDLRGRPGAK